jgi:Tol biopolymer transport system component
MAFAPDGRSLALVLTDYTIRLYAPATGKELRALAGLPGSPVATALAYSPDGKTLAASGGATIRRWNAADGTVLSEGDGHAGVVQSLAVSPDGKRLASTAGDLSLRVWDLAARRAEHTLPGPKRAEFDDIVNQFRTSSSAAFAPDGRALVAAWGDGHVCTFDLTAGKKVREFKVGELGAVSVAFTPGARQVFTADLNNEIHLNDVASGRALRRYRDFSRGDGEGNLAIDGNFPEVTVSPDGRTLAAVGTAADGKSMLHMWEAATGRPRRVFTLSAEMRGIGLPGAVGIGAPAVGGNYFPPPPRFAPDGRTLAVLVHGSVRVWSLSRGKETRRLDAEAALPSSLAFTPDGKMLAVGHTDGTVSLWDLATGAERARLRGHRGAVGALTFADGKTLISGANDTTVLVWDIAAAGAEELRPPELSADEVARLWDELASDSPTVAYDAQHKLAAAHDQAVALIQARLRPVLPADAERVRRLVADLEHERFEVRRRAADELERFGELAETELRRRLNGQPPLEVQTRINQLLDKLEGAVTDPERLQALRAVELLEWVGNRDARALLERVAQGVPASRVTQEARKALERLARSR